MEGISVLAENVIKVEDVSSFSKYDLLSVWYEPFMYGLPEEQN